MEKSKREKNPKTPKDQKKNELNYLIIKSSLHLMLVIFAHFNALRH